MDKGKNCRCKIEDGYMKEIGGYFGIEENLGGEYHLGALGFNTARNALRYIIQVRNIKRIYVPKLCCDAVFFACKGADVILYDIDENFLPILKNIHSDSWIYLINYNGFLSDDYINDIVARYNNIILDNVQAFFRRPIGDIDTIYSCRKFFGVSDGAYLYTTLPNLLYDKLTMDVSGDRLKHLVGRLEKNANKFYGVFQQIEQDLYRQPIRKMSLFTKNVLSGINYEQACKKRSRNFKKIKELIGRYNQMEVGNVSGAYMYPFVTSDAERVRENLIKHKIYTPILWPNVLEDYKRKDIAYKFANEIIYLPVDQRYDENDMNYMADILVNII